MSNETINTIIDKKAYEQVDKLAKDLEQLDLKFLKVAESASKLGKNSFKVQGVKQYNNQIAESSKYLTESNALNKEAERLNNGLTRAKAKLALSTSDANKALVKYRYETQQSNKEEKEAAVLSSRHASAMQKLTVQRNQAKRALQDYAAKQALGINLTEKEEREIKQLRAEYSRLDGAYRKSNRVVGEYFDNVGNYQSGMQKFTGMVRGLVGAFGLVEGARIGLNFAKESIELARQAKSVEFAFDRLGQRGVTAFENIKTSTRGLLSDLDIKKSINEFENFNISLEESDTLFEFLAVRAAQTGQSVDKLKDSLVEGLSKESKLRIDNLGISASELNSELEQTPDFVQAVANIAKREIKEAGNILDETASETEKWNAALVNLKVNFGKILDSKSLGLLGLASKFVGDFADGLVTLELGFKSLGVGVSSFLDRFKVLKGVFDDFKLPSVTETFGQFFITAGAFLNGFSRAVGAAKEQLFGFLKQFATLDFTNPIRLFNSIKDVEFELKGKSVGLAFKEGFADALKEVYKVSEEVNNDIVDDVENTNEKVVTAVDGSVQSYEKLISKLKELRNTTATNTQQYNEFSKAIEAVEDKVEILKNGLGELSTEHEQYSKTVANANDGILDSTQRVIDRNNAEIASTDDKTKKFKISVTDQEEAITSSLRTIGDAYGLDLQLFESMLNKKEISLAEFASQVGNLLTSVSEFILSNTVANIDAEIAAQDKKYDRILSNENLTADERDRIRDEQEAKRRQLERKRLQAEKDQAIFQSVIATAVAVVQALPLIPLSIAVGTLGALQTAAIASRPIPEYWRGKPESDNYEGIATVGEKRTEVIKSKDGSIRLTPSVPTLTYVGKDDIIYPSVEDFESKHAFPTQILQSVTKKGDTSGYDLNKLSNKIIEANRKSLGSAKFINTNINKSQDINHAMWKQMHINV